MSTARTIQMMERSYQCSTMLFHMLFHVVYMSFSAFQPLMSCGLRTGLQSAPKKRKILHVQKHDQDDFAYHTNHTFSDLSCNLQLIGTWFYNIISTRFHFIDKIQKLRFFDLSAYKIETNAYSSMPIALVHLHMHILAACTRSVHEYA